MTTDSHPPDGSDSPTSAWVVVVDYETGAEVERRGPFTDQADVEEALRSLRAERKGARYVIRVRVECRAPDIGAIISATPEPQIGA